MAISLLNEPNKIFDPEGAREAAEDLQDGDPDWTYEVEISESGNRASINIYDEDGFFVSKF